jgi:nucleoside-diphosphate-sugar epimerase
MTINKILSEDLETIYQSNVDWTRFCNTTVLITGASGFLPAYLVESLLYLNTINDKYNVKVLALVRNIEGAEAKFAAHNQSPFLTFINQDVSEKIDIVDNIDYIIHAASQASPKYYGTDPVGTLKANILGTINLAELAKSKNVKSFLYFSSGEVYGEIPVDKVPTKEDDYGYIDPTQVRSCYGESKRMGENICVSYHKQFNIPVKIVRPFHTYGPGMKLDDGRVYADFVSNILNNQNIVLNSDGSAIRAFCYLTDATIGFFKVLLDGVDGEAYNVGNPNEEYSILRLAEILVGLYPDKSLSVVIKGDIQSNIYLKSPIKRNSPDINKINKLNWIPKVSVEEGFYRTIKSYE